MRSLVQPVSTGKFYTPDEQPLRHSKRSEFVYAVDANRTERVIGWYQSQVNKTSFPFHSTLERKAMRLLDLNPATKWFKAQPDPFEIEYDGKCHKYTPDLVVHYRQDSPVYVEVKPRAELATLLVNTRMHAALRLFAGMGAKFRIFTDTQLNREPRNTNVVLLQRYRSLEPDLQLAHRVDIALGRRPQMSLGELIALCGEPRLARRTILSLVYRRHLQFDLHQPINSQLLISHAW